MIFTVKDEPFAVGFLSEKSENLTKKVAAGCLAANKVMDVEIYDSIGLPNCFPKNMASYYCYYFGTYCNFDEIARKAANDKHHAKEYNYIGDALRKYCTYERNIEDFTPEEKQAIKSMGAWGGTWVGHSVPNLIDVANYGTDGLRKKVLSYKAKNPASADFYDGLLIYLDAVDELGKRVLEKAEKMLSESSHKDKIRRLIKTFEKCPKSPAETFADACGVYIMLFSYDGVDSPGHFDQYMIDFWRKSDPRESRTMLCDMWEFFHMTRTWNLCIGGSDENGNDLTNELTYEILKITAELKYNTPNLTMRCHAGTPESLFDAAAKAIATGCGLPAFYNDRAVCPALERLGIPPEDSHKYVMNGCNQIDIQGKSHMGLEDGEVNLGKAVELAFSNGIDTFSGVKIGADTGDVTSFDTYEKFFDAVKTQIHHLCDLSVSMANKCQKVYSEIMGNPLRSLCMEGCLEKGLDYKCGGPLYGHGQILAEGVADCIDSVAAVKKYVYDEGRFTMKELAAAVSSNFEGYSEMLAFLRKSPLRFGNDNPYVDLIGKKIIDDYNTYLETKKTYRGGTYGGGCSPFTRAAGNGQGTGALPSGRMKGEALYADSIGAVPGRDEKGPTALLKSCLSFDHTLPTSGFILNVKFDRKLFNTKKGMAGFKGLLKAYFENGGQMLTATVVSREELLDAKENPDSHRDLIVRVGGYSDYFVNLSPELQDNVIARTSYEL